MRHRIHFSRGRIAYSAFRRSTVLCPPANADELSCSTAGRCASPPARINMPSPCKGRRCRSQRLDHRPLGVFRSCVFPQDPPDSVSPKPAFPRVAMSLTRETLLPLARSVLCAGAHRRGARPAPSPQITVVAPWRHPRRYIQILGLYAEIPINYLIFTC